MTGPKLTEGRVDDRIDSAARALWEIARKALRENGGLNEASVQLYGPQAGSVSAMFGLTAEEAEDISLRVFAGAVQEHRSGLWKN